MEDVEYVEKMEDVEYQGEKYEPLALITREEWDFEERDNFALLIHEITDGAVKVKKALRVKPSGIYTCPPQEEDGVQSLEPVDLIEADGTAIIKKLKEQMLSHGK